MSQKIIVLNIFGGTVIKFSFWVAYAWLAKMMCPGIYYPWQVQIIMTLYNKTLNSTNIFEVGHRWQTINENR